MTKTAPVSRNTVDLSGYPDLVVIHLGMKVSNLKGLNALARTGREIGQAVAAKRLVGSLPEGSQGVWASGAAFAPVLSAKGPMFSARGLLGAGKGPAAPVEETAL